MAILKRLERYTFQQKYWQFKYMSEVSINNAQYNFISDYLDNEHLRKSFNDLTQKIFEFDLEDLHQKGYLRNSYIPYSLVYNNQIVSNVSINRMNFTFESQSYSFIQIGTVMTLPDFRKKGLSKFLLEKVIAEWENRCDLIYLFANDTVFDFYPKFGFTEQKEYNCSINKTEDNTNFKTHKIDLSNINDFSLFIDTIQKSTDFKQLSHLDNLGLALFYCTSYLSNSIYYLEDLKTIAIFNIENETLILHDIFCKEEINLNQVINYLFSKNISKIELGFTPKDPSLFNISEIIEDDTKLFIKNNKTDIFKNSNLRFPFLSRA